MEKETDLRVVEGGYDDGMKKKNLKSLIQEIQGTGIPRRMCDTHV